MPVLFSHFSPEIYFYISIKLVPLFQLIYFIWKHSNTSKKKDTSEKDGTTVPSHLTTHITSVLWCPRPLQINPGILETLNPGIRLIPNKKLNNLLLIHHNIPLFILIRIRRDNSLRK